MLTSSTVDHRFQSRSGQSKDYQLGICCFSAKHAALSIISKNWLAQYQDHASEWSDVSTRRLLSLNWNQLSVLV
jgi:hypothetical protein